MERRRDDRMNRLRWRRDLILFGGLLVILLAVGLVIVGNEREARVDTAATVIALGCETDNSQDETLAALVEISLDPGAAAFGANIDTSKLTQFDVKVIASIARVQQLAADAPPTEQEEVFNRQLAELNDLQPCEALAQAYKDGASITELDEICSATVCRKAEEGTP